MAYKLVVHFENLLEQLLTYNEPLYNNPEMSLKLLKAMGKGLQEDGFQVELIEETSTERTLTF
jgi:hypothetical protein